MSEAEKLVEDVARALDEVIFNPELSFFQQRMIEAKAVLAVAEPIITKRAEERVLREFIAWNNGRSHEAETFAYDFARERYNLEL